MAGVVTAGPQRQQRALTGDDVVDVAGPAGEDCPSVGGNGVPAHRGSLIVIKRIVASVFVAVVAVVGASAPAANADTSAATFKIDWE